VETRVMEALRAHFRPEFLNRVDDTILFRPLSPKRVETLKARGDQPPSFERMTIALAEPLTTKDLAKLVAHLAKILQSRLEGEKG